MAVYRFSLSFTDAQSDEGLHSYELPPYVSVMHAGELVCKARLENDAYACELPEEYASKLNSGKLEQVFVYEPPILDEDTDKSIGRELVSILLIGVTRKSTDPA